MNADGFFRLESGRAYISSDESLFGNGCEEYTFWNPILADEGVSPWGWKQNALIRWIPNQAKAIFTAGILCREALHPFPDAGYEGDGV